MTPQRKTTVIAVGLGIVLVASIVANIYLYSQVDSLSGQLNTANSQNQAFAQSFGTFIRNGTTYEESVLQSRMTLPNGTIQSIVNGTTIIFGNVAFTYIAKNWNCSCVINLFKVGSPDGQWSEMLRISPPATSFPKTNEVYTDHVYPSAGLAMNYNSTLIFLLASVGYNYTITTNSG